VPLVRFDGKTVAALNIGVQPEQVSTKAMIVEYVPLLVKEAEALRARLVSRLANSGGMRLRRRQRMRVGTAAQSGGGR
jgi:hypothetical protein